MKSRLATKGIVLEYGLETLCSLGKPNSRHASIGAPRECQSGFLGPWFHGCCGLILIANFLGLLFERLFKGFILIIEVVILP